MLKTEDVKFLEIVRKLKILILNQNYHVHLTFISLTSTVIRMNTWFTRLTHFYIGFSQSQFSETFDGVTEGRSLESIVTVTSIIEQSTPRKKYVLNNPLRTTFIVTPS